MTIASHEAPTPYEQSQIDQIRAWRHQPPGVIERASAVALSPVARLVSGLVPSAAIEALLRASDWMAAKTIPSSQASDDVDLQLLDTEARAIRSWAIAYAGSEGAIAGAVGLVSLPVDLPAIITLSLRTIRRIGTTYGYAATSEQEKQFIYAVLSIASANSARQKRDALESLRGLETQMLAHNWATIGERAARRGVGAESILLLARDVAEQLGFNLTKRKALAALPLVGAAMGATVNGWYMRDIGAAAQRAYQQRWLQDRGLYRDQ
jgi:EcsC protein family